MESKSARKKRLSRERRAAYNKKDDTVALKIGPTTGATDSGATDSAMARTLVDAG